MALLRFDDFLNEREGVREGKGKKVAAGIAAIYNNKILLIHPTNSSWQKSTCGIPKGGIEPHEDTMEAAIREFREETGIIVSPDMLDPEPHKVIFYNSKMKETGQMIYYVCPISDLSELELETERVPSDQLHLEEVDWGKFVSAEEAYPIMSRAQLIILDRHLTLDK
jgi:8-oxo-dGTP pyrophosphatase MutT (NUDIX family)